MNFNMEKMEQNDKLISGREILANNLERPEDVPPIFEKLREEDKQFILEVRELNKIIEEDFLKNHPEILEAKKQLQDKFRFKSWENFVPEEVSVHIDRYKAKKFTKPENLGDKAQTDCMATIWELTKLRLFELQDTIQHPGFYSKQTEYLVEHILDGIAKAKLDSLPDKLWGLKNMGWRSILEKNAEDSDRTQEATFEKIRVIHRFVNAFHQKILGNMAIYYIKDLWRYVAVRIINIKDKEEWDAIAQGFFDKLSNLNIEDGKF